MMPPEEKIFGSIDILESLAKIDELIP